MHIELATSLLIGLMLGSIRVIAWMVTSPVLSNRAFSVKIKALLSVALVLPVVDQISTVKEFPDIYRFIEMAVLQFAAGACLGFLTAIIFSAVEAAGDLLDLFGGFSLASSYDPLNYKNNAVFGKIYHLMALTLLFAVNGHLLMLRGLFASYDFLPLDSAISLPTFIRLATGGVSSLLVGALQIAGPLIAVLFLADIGLGLLTRAAPALNAFALGFPIKIGLTLMLVGMSFSLLPAAVSHLIDQSINAMMELVKA